MRKKTPMTRSEMMRAVHSRDTKPEILVRKALFRKGFRFRLQRRDLPGRPDIFVLRHNVIVFVNGCFWHRHGCALTTLPKSRSDFWNEKFDKNVARDVKTLRELSLQGFRVAIVWECALKKNPKRAMETLGSFIAGDEEFIEI